MCCNCRVVQYYSGIVVPQFGAVSCATSHGNQAVLSARGAERRTCVASHDGRPVVRSGQKAAAPLQAQREQNEVGFPSDPVIWAGCDFISQP